MSIIIICGFLDLCIYGFMDLWICGFWICVGTSVVLALNTIASHGRPLPRPLLLRRLHCLGRARETHWPSIAASRCGAAAQEKRGGVMHVEHIKMNVEVNIRTTTYIK